MYHIYSIESHVTSETYTGITRDLDLTRYYHEECSVDGDTYLYTFIRSHGGWKNFYVKHVSSHETIEEARDEKVSGNLNVYDQSINHVPTIYKIFCRDPNVPQQYVGQTINFDNRRCSHFLSSSFYENTIKLYEFIRSHGGWKNWKMEIIKQYPMVTTKQDLDRLEWYWWDKLGGELNSVIPGSHKEKWRGSDQEFEESVCLGLNLKKFSIKEISINI